MSLREKGYLTVCELLNSNCYPYEERLDKGPVAIIECNEQIPCNPCEVACRFNAIKVGKPITNPPILDENLCTGCGECISRCPGLAIFVIDKTYSNKDGLVSFPYEYFPLPEKGSIVEAVDRKGETICNGEVVRVLNPKKYDRTPVVSIKVPKEKINEVRGIKRIQINDKSNN